MPKLSAKAIFALFLVLISILRLFAATGIGQTVDEAHYVLYGRSLALSYFDHPPLVGWVHWLFQQLPVSDLLKARLPAVLISLLTTRLLRDYMFKHRVDEKVIYFSLAALNLTPIFNSLSIALLPDTLLMPLTVAIINKSEDLLEKADLKNWLLMGAFLGLAGLSKYTSVVYVLALLVIFAERRLWSQLLRPHLWAGVAVSMALVSPVLIWNLKHDFMSFKYQGHHVLSFDRNALNSLMSSLGIQLISWGIGPFLLVLWAQFGWLKRFRTDRHRRVPVIFLTLFFFFFLYLSLSEVLLPHWMLIYFTVAVPLAVAEGYKRRFTWAACGVSALLSLCLLVETAFKVFPIQWTAKLFEGVEGWDSAVAEAAILADKAGADVELAVMNWTLGSRTIYYNRSSHKVFVLDQRVDQFDIWNSESPVHKNFLVLIEADKKDEHLVKLNCREIAMMGKKETVIKGVPVNSFLYYYCADFQNLTN